MFKIVRSSLFRSCAGTRRTSVYGNVFSCSLMSTKVAVIADTPPNVELKSGNIPTKNISKTHNTLIETYKNIVVHRKKQDIGDETFDLYQRQVIIEEDQYASAIEEYMETLAQMTAMGRATSKFSTQRILLKWYEPLMASIETERAAVKSSAQSQHKNRTIYNLMDKIPVEKLTVITLTTAFNAVLKSGNAGAKLVNVTLDIGEEIETECNLKHGKREISRQNRDDKESVRAWQKDAVSDPLLANRNELRHLHRKLKSITPDRYEEWSSEDKVKVGGILLDLLINTATTEEGGKAFILNKTYSHTAKRIQGILKLQPEMYTQLINDEVQHSTPRLLPMLVPPLNWDNHAQRGAYLRLRAPLMKTSSKLQKEALREAEMDDVLVGVNYLGKTAWRINEPILDVVQAARKMNLAIGEIPSNIDMPLPDREACKRLPREIHAEREAWKNSPNNRSRVAAASTPAVTIEDKVDAPPATATKDETVSLPTTTSSTALLAGAKKKRKAPPKIEEVELDLTSDVPVVDEKLYKEMCRRVQKKNSELHSLRCDMEIKLNIAEKFRKDVIYFPHNLDFRGRAYPVPPNLSHLGSDLCRGILTFDQKRPLGKDGFRWLKIHLCNLYGNNKISLDDRVKWTESHMSDLLDSAERPIEGQRWWSSFESPFQALACCMEIKAVMECPDHEQFMSCVPVHQDGSCNGLQHYAGLGRDSKGGQAVNLVPSDTPQDVYSKVLEHVLAQIEIDRQLPLKSDTDESTAGATVDSDNLTMSKQEKFKAEKTKKRAEDAAKYARMVHGTVNRKVIKQTVMTSVYGVTMTGARAQVQARLEDKFKEQNPGAIITPEVDKELFFAAFYVANLTLSSLDKMFQSAKGIMEWLGQCSSIVSEQRETMAWITPLGLPVMQPYRKVKQHQVKTVLQQITLTYQSDHLPVSSRKQRSAFPPNFVHSLDATHMLMTCRKMMDEGKTFAAVHDSYWTHACDVPLMNKVLRECFVHLYEYPVLDELKESLDMRFPDAEFPQIPKRGDLDVRLVKNSQYFFH